MKEDVLNAYIKMYGSDDFDNDPDEDVQKEGVEETREDIPQDRVDEEETSDEESVPQEGGDENGPPEEGGEEAPIEGGPPQEGGVSGVSPIIDSALREQGLDPENIDESIIQAMQTVMANSGGDGELNSEVAKDILDRFIAQVGDVTEAVAMMSEYVSQYGETAVAQASSGGGMGGEEPFGGEDGSEKPFPPKEGGESPPSEGSDGASQPQVPKSDGDKASSGTGGSGASKPGVKQPGQPKGVESAGKDDSDEPSDEPSDDAPPKDKKPFGKDEESDDK